MAFNDINLLILYKKEILLIYIVHFLDEYNKILQNTR